MLIPFKCPQCGAPIEVSDEYAGQTGPCAQCGKTVPVPLPRQKISLYGLVLVLVLVAALGGGAVLLLPVIQKKRTGGAPPQCKHHLKQLGLALHNYHDTHGSFPPAYTTDENGNRLHSWRVLLLPHMEEQDLYDMIDLERPWDSAENQVFADMMPCVYGCPDSPALGNNSRTSYAMIVGPGTISEGPAGRKMADFSDRLSQTLMVVEVSGLGFNWMEPRDLDDQTISFAVNDGSGSGIGGHHPSGAWVMMCDGSVHFLDDATDPSQIEAMSTIDGGEVVDPNF